MPRSKWPAIALAVLLLVGLIVGMAYFAGLTTRDTYPEMSSLNPGPTGTQLLFDSLSRVETVKVSRNYLPFSQWHPALSTILLFNISSFTLNYAGKEDLAELETLARANNRVVLCIPDDSFAGKTEEKKPQIIKARWGIQIVEAKKTKEKDAELLLDHDASWQPVPNLDDAVEKRFPNGGVIVIAMHSDDFSNEFIATNSSGQSEVPPLIGEKTSVIFDETHLGIEESGSIASLAKRYRLQGLVAGLLILFGLFIWNQSVSFPPPARFEQSQDKQVLGADSRSTFAGLIARHLTPRSLLESCIAEWNRVKPRQHITAELPAKLDPVAAYRQLQETLPKTRREL